MIAQGRAVIQHWAGLMELKHGRGQEIHDVMKKPLPLFWTLGLPGSSITENLV